MTIVNLGVFQEVVDEGSEECSVRKLGDLFSTFHKLQLMRAFEYIDNVLKHQDWSLLAPEAMIGYVRINCLYKDDLVEWYPALMKIKEELEVRGFNTEEELAGLL